MRLEKEGVSRSRERVSTSTTAFRLPRLLRAVFLLAVAGCGERCGDAPGRPDTGKDASPSASSTDTSKVESTSTVRVGVPSKAVRVLFDGAELATLRASDVGESCSLFERLGSSQVTQERVILIRARDGEGRNAIEVVRPSELHADEVATLRVVDGSIHFGMAVEGGGVTPNVANVGTVELFTKLPDEVRERRLVAPAMPPIELDTELFESVARGSTTPPARERDRDGTGAKRANGSGEPGKRERESGGGRPGVEITLDALLKRLVPELRISEVRLSGPGGTMVLDGGVLSGSKDQLRLKFNREGRLKFRRFRGDPTRRDIVEELDEVEQIVVR